MEKNTTALNDQIQNEVEATKEQFPDYTIMSLKELIQAFEEMLERGDQQELYKHSDFIKSAFYKVLRAEKSAAGIFVAPVDERVSEEGATEATEESVNVEESSDIPTESTEADTTDVSESGEVNKLQEVVSNNPFAEIERGFKELYAKYRAGRLEYVQNLEKIKEENFAQKLEVIEELKVLLDKAEDINLTFPAFRELQNKWKSISNLVPQAKSKGLWESYQHCIEKFYDYIKINNEFRDLDFKKNLEAKTLLCEKAEALDKEANIVVAFKELQSLHEEWKEVGPVAKEFRDTIWERFKTITSTINKKHQNFFEGLKESQKVNLEAKTTLCEEAEAIASKTVEHSNDWNTLSKQIEALQSKWKSIGFAAKKDNQKIYDRFRTACDKFYNAKREYYADFKNVMQSNLAKKEELCAQAEALMSSEDWKKATDQLINLQKVWKEVGPVARKQSDIVWKRFRAACDAFFDRKTNHFGKVDEKYEENLAAKLELIEKIKAYELTNSKEDDTKAMREFSDAWNAIGFVPFREKEKIQKLYNTAMDAHFLDIRSVNSEKKMTKFKKMISEASDKGGRGLRFEREKLMQRFRKMEADIATLENNMGFFAKSKNADLLIGDIKKKITIAKEELAQVEEKIKLIDKQFEQGSNE